MKKRSTHLTNQLVAHRTLDTFLILEYNQKGDVIKEDNRQVTI